MSDRLDRSRRRNLPISFSSIAIANKWHPAYTVPLNLYLQTYIPRFHLPICTSHSQHIFENVPKHLPNPSERHNPVAGYSSPIRHRCARVCQRYSRAIKTRHLCTMKMLSQNAIHVSPSRSLDRSTEGLFFACTAVGQIGAVWYRQREERHGFVMAKTLLMKWKEFSVETHGIGMMLVATWASDWNRHFVVCSVLNFGFQKCSVIVCL